LEVQLEIPQHNFALKKPKLPQLWYRFQNNFRLKKIVFHGENYREKKMLFTCLRYTCKTQMTSVKESIIPLSSKNHIQLDELFI
jgi:hypothetical protein